MVDDEVEHGSALLVAPEAGSGFALVVLVNTETLFKEIVFCEDPGLR